VFSRARVADSPRRVEGGGTRPEVRFSPRWRTIGNVSSREEAVGKNEAVFREVNERIRELTMLDDDAEFLCECGDPTCVQPITLRLDEYEAVRDEATHFLIVPGHDLPDLESVVRENDRYAVVRKHAGAASEIAARHDPRA
jgi:hypothetical protein